jgi:glycine/D-amino acid oxidase-like deaminating enzyme
MAHTSRRALLEAAGSAAVAAVLSGCAGRRVPAGPWPEATRRFPPVRVSEDRVIRTVVGLRPYRASGFVLRAEKLGDKTIVHNYGHGGAGITLSWGCSEIAAEEAWSTGERRFAVLGCGALGLASARLLQRRGADVTIYAKELPPHTTSNIAGGQWSPFSVMDAARRSAESDALLARAARLSHRSFQQLPGAEYGIRWLENYLLSDAPHGEPWEESLIGDLYPERRDLGPGEHAFPTRYAYRLTTMLVEPPVYLPAMERDVRLAGGHIVVRELRSRDEVQALPERAVVNCTGLGAKALFGDAELEPVRGQLTFLLPQPEVDYIVIAGQLYMFPRRDGILLGGTFEHGDWSLEPREETRRRMLAGHRALFEAMG